MSRGLVLAMASAMLSLPVGCGSESGSGGLAVVDLDEVAKQLGRDEQIRQAIAEKQDELNRKLRFGLHGSLAQARADAQRELAQFRQAQIAQFRDEVKPIAQKIATERGLSIVVPKNEGFLLSFESSVDITGDVTEQMKAADGAAAVERLSDAGSKTTRQ